MSELFDLVSRINDGRFVVAMFGVAVAALAVSAGLRFYLHWRRKGAVSVHVRVVDLIEDRTGHDPTYKPVFVILAGIYKGQRYVSEVGANPPDHQIGDEVTGHYQPESGVITSARTAADLKRIANFALWASGVAAVCGVYFAWRFYM